MKLLHRLLATAGLAALLGPHPADAAQKHRSAQPPEVAGMPAQAGQLDPQVLDRLLAKALAGRPVTMTNLGAALPGFVAAAVTAAPAAMPPDRLAALVAQRVVALLLDAGMTLDVPTRANLASEIIAGVVDGYGRRGLAVDRIAVAAATLGRMGQLARNAAPALDRYTAATGDRDTAATGGMRDVSDGDRQRNSAY